MFFVLCGSKENPFCEGGSSWYRKLLMIRRRLQLLIWSQLLWTSDYVCIISGFKCCILQYKTCTLESHFNYFFFFSAWNWSVGKHNVCFINTPNITLLVEKPSDYELKCHYVRNNVLRDYAFFHQWSVVYQSNFLTDLEKTFLVTRT